MNSATEDTENTEKEGEWDGDSADVSALRLRYPSLAMTLLPTQADERSLAALGEEASTLLLQRDYVALANRFGYALAYDRDHAAAIEADFLNALASPLDANADGPISIAVKYFSENDPALFALVECTVRVTATAAVLLELIVAGKDENKHIFIEEISGVPSQINDCDK